MISMLTWTLRRTLLWSFILLSSTLYPCYCNMEQHKSVATKIDEEGKSPTFVHEGPEEVREAPISGFDFYSKEDYGEDWWDDDLRFYNEDELDNFPSVQDKQINAATNLKLGESSNFINSGHIGSNMNYDARDSTINAGIFSTNRIFADTEFQQAKPWRVDPHSNMAKKDKDFLGEIHSQTQQTKETYPGVHFPQRQWRTMNSAVNLDLSPKSTFGNKGTIGSNIEVIRNPVILRSQSIYYPEKMLSLPSNLQSENMNAAANLKAGYEAKLVNEGDIGSNLIYNVAQDKDTNIIHSGSFLPQKQWRTKNSAANLKLGSMSTFDNRGQIGSNIEVKRIPVILGSQILYFPDLLLRYPSRLQSEDMSSTVNLNTGDGSRFLNEGEIGSNLIYNAESDANTNNVHSRLNFPQRQWRTMNSAANLDLGPTSIFGNRGSIGSNIEVIRKPAMLRSQGIYYPEKLLSYPSNLQSENLNAAANLKAGYEAKLANEGDIGSNVIYNVAEDKDMNIIHSGSFLPQNQWRTMNSAANIDLGSMSTFGNKGKIGSNIKAKRIPAILRSQSQHYSNFPLSYYSSLRSEDMNSAVNLNTGDGSKFVNEGEIGSNIIYMSERGTNRNNVHSGLDFPQRQLRTMNSAANLDLGPMSIFDNRGKIGSNIEVIKKPTELRSQNVYYPEILLSYPPSFRSENLNAATNLKTGYGAKVFNEGEIGSNLVYNIARRTRSLPRIYSKTHLPYLHKRTLNSEANLNIGRSSVFGNKGSIGSNIGTENHYHPEITLRHSQSLLPENLNAATNLNIAHGGKFDNEGEIGSNILQMIEKSKYTNNMQPEMLSPWQQGRTLGPLSIFGKRGEIGSNIEVKRIPAMLRSQTIHYPEILESYHPRSRPENLNAEANLKAGYGAKFDNEGKIASNELHIGARTEYPNKVRPKVYFPQQQWRTMNAAANLDLGPASTFDNRGKIGSNIAEIRKPAILRSQNLYYPYLLLSYPSSLRSDNMNAAPNLNTEYGSTFVNEGDAASNLVYNAARVINDDAVRRNIGGKLFQRFVLNSNQPSSDSLYESQSSMSNPYVYDLWALRTAENDANRKSNKGKNILIESGSSFGNQGTIGNEEYEMHGLPFEIKLRTPVTSYAYVIPPSGKGRSALSGGRVVTGISTKTRMQQPKIDINNNYNRNLKHAFNERSSFINDGTISAAEILLSPGSAVAFNRSNTQMSRFSPAAVSFGKLGLDMAHSSNKASIVAGDNAQIFINGKMGTYQVSIPIGSIVASEGSGVSSRIFNPYWSNLFSETSELGLKSPLNFFTNLNSVITGVVKVGSIDFQGRERVDLCELENPITAVEIGRPLPSNQLLLQLLFITKLRINLANLLSYLTAKSAAKFDEDLYVSLQIIYNAVQYRQINILPLLLFNTNLNLPPKLHFRAILEILESIAPLNVRYAVKTLIQDVEKHEVKYIGISENLISLLTDTLDLDMIPDIVAELQGNVIFGNVDVFVNQIVEKAFSLITYEKSVRDLKDILYLTMLNLPLSYSVPQLPIKLRLVAQMLFMELTDDVWICAAMKAQYIPSTNVYTDLKNFFRLLLECPTVPANIQPIVWDTVQILPDAMPSNDIHELNITSSGSTAAEVIVGDIENDLVDTPVEVTNSLGNIIVK